MIDMEVLKMLKNNKISMNCLIISTSILFLLISSESSFTVQSIIIPFIALFLYIMVKEKKFLVSKNNKTLALLFCIYSISLLFNFFRHGINAYSIIQMIYFGVIVGWYFLGVQKKFTKEELHFFIKIYVYICLFSSLYIAFNNILFKNNTFAIVNFVGVKMEKNYFGAILSLAPVFVLYKILYDKHKIINILCIVLLFLAILYSNSRGALLASILACVCLVGIHLKHYASKKLITVLLISFICGLFLIKPIVSNLLPEWLYNRYFVNSYNDYSNNDRVYRWKNAFEGFSKQPILGYGPGVLYSIDEYKYTDLNIAVNKSTISHNTFLDILVDGGIIGILVFILFLWQSFKPFILKHRLYLPIIINIIINAGILGAGKTVYLWNTLIFLTLLSKYLKDAKVNNIFLNNNVEGEKNGK